MAVVCDGGMQGRALQRCEAGCGAGRWGAGAAVGRRVARRQVEVRGAAG